MVAALVHLGGKYVDGAMQIAARLLVALHLHVGHANVVVDERHVGLGRLGARQRVQRLVEERYGLVVASELTVRLAEAREAHGELSHPLLMSASPEASTDERRCCLCACCCCRRRRRVEWLERAVEEAHGRLVFAQSRVDGGHIEGRGGDVRQHLIVARRRRRRRRHELGVDAERAIEELERRVELAEHVIGDGHVVVEARRVRVHQGRVHVVDNLQRAVEQVDGEREVAQVAVRHAEAGEHARHHRLGVRVLELVVAHEGVESGVELVDGELIAAGVVRRLGRRQLGEHERGVILLGVVATLTLVDVERAIEGDQRRLVASRVLEGAAEPVGDTRQVHVVLVHVDTLVDVERLVEVRGGLVEALEGRERVAHVGERARHVHVIARPMHAPIDGHHAKHHDVSGKIN